MSIGGDNGYATNWGRRARAGRIFSKKSWWLPLNFPLAATPVINSAILGIQGVIWDVYLLTWNNF
jgi:hypothetical protein